MFVIEFMSAELVVCSYPYFYKLNIMVCYIILFKQSDLIFITIIIIIITIIIIIIIVIIMIIHHFGIVYYIIILQLLKCILIKYTLTVQRGKINHTIYGGGVTTKQCFFFLTSGSLKLQCTRRDETYRKGGKLIEFNEAETRLLKRKNSLASRRYAVLAIFWKTFRSHLSSQQL